MLAIADPDLVNFSDGQPSEFGESGLHGLKTRLTYLFERFATNLVVTVIEIRVQGNVAYDYGWHDLTLTPKQGGEPIRRRGSLCGYLAEGQRRQLEAMDVDR